MDKEVRDFFFIVIIFVVLLAPGFINSEFFNDFKDIWDSITGLVVLDTTNASVAVASIAPVIAFNDVEPPATQTITENSYINVSFVFNATDADGAGTLNNASATGYFNRTGQLNVSANYTCRVLSNVNTTTNRYNCTVPLWWFAENGTWTVNVTINDTSGSFAQQTGRTFTVAETKGMQMDPQALTWTGINLGNQNKTATGNITINNTANVNLGNVNVTGYNLHGRTTPAQFIYAANLSVNTANACEGNALANATQVRVTGATINAGNHTPDSGVAQEELVFCLEAIEGPGGSLSVQNYDTSTSIDWDIRVN